MNTLNDNFLLSKWIKPFANTSTGNPQINSRDLWPFKVALLGRAGVGKTSLIAHYMKNEYKDRRSATSSADNYKRTVIIDDSYMKLELWDTPGADRYANIIHFYYQRCHASVLVYDITRRETYDWAKQMAIEIKYLTGHNSLIALVGNKSDLAAVDGGGGHRAVAALEGLEFATLNDFIFMETSVKSGTNLHNVLLTMARLLPQYD